MVLPLANVTVCGSSTLTDAQGTYSIACPTSTGCSCATTCTVAVWARQYEPVARAHVDAAKGAVVLNPRLMPGFPASNWRFEGWAVQAQTADVPGTNIAFLAHPSAYRPPSGNRVFVTSTANSHGGPGWTQGYWQTDGAVQAAALPYALVNRSNPALHGTAFTGRMIKADGRLLMLIGMGNVALPVKHT